MGRQNALHKENSGFAAPTLGRHISTFRGYQILFSIRNPYINRFTNHFSIHSKPSYPQKVVLHSITARFSLTPSHFAISLSLSNICHVTSRKLRLPQCIMGDDLHIWSYLVQNERGENVTLALSEAGAGVSKIFEQLAPSKYDWPEKYRSTKWFNMKGDTCNPPPRNRKLN